MNRAGRTAMLVGIGMAQALCAGAAIERLEFTYATTAGPQGILLAWGPGTIYRLSDGRSLTGGAGMAKSGLVTPSKVERVEGGFRYTLPAPADGIVHAFLFDIHDTWVAGKIITDAAAVLTTRADSPTADLVVHGRMAPPDRVPSTPAGTNGHLPAASPGTEVQIRATVALESGTWSADQFDRPFRYTLAGSIDFPPSPGAPPSPTAADPVPVLFPDPQFRTQEGSGTIRYNLFLAQPLDREVSVELRSTGSASPGSDYVLAPARIVFPAGVTNAEIQITLPADEEHEPTETLELSFAPSTPSTKQWQCLTIHIEDVQKDSDGDGLPDWWETKYFRSPVAARPEADGDRDGWTNLQEYQRGADPKSRQTPDRANRLGLEVWTPLDPAPAVSPTADLADLPDEAALRPEAENQPDQTERVTEIVRDPKTGWVTAKKLSGRVVQSFTYRNNGQIQSVTDANGGTSTFQFNPAGEVVRIDYSDGTPPLAITRTRMGQIESLQTAGVDLTYSYDPLRRTLVRYSGSNILNHACAYAYTNTHNEITARVLAVDNRTNRVDLQYGAGSILEKLTDADLMVTYTYRNGALLETTTLARRDGTPLLLLRQTWDTFGEHVTERAWRGQRGPCATLRIEREPSTMRVARAQWSDGENWEYQYDTLGRISHATFRETPGETSSLLVRLGYAWNARCDLFLAGPAQVGNLIGNAFEANQLNLLVQREWEGRVSIRGRVRDAADTVVSVNDLPCERNGAWFRCLLPVDNRNGATTIPVVVRAVKGAETVERAGFVSRPGAMEKPLYSRAGELLKDNRQRYRYDVNGNLVAIDPAGKGNTPRVTFTYYPDGLRASKTVHALVDGQWQPVRRHRFAYDRSCLVYEEIVERTQGATIAWSREYLWGLDLADQTDATWRLAAQGLGGLLAVKVRRDGKCRVLAPICDGSGNITRLFDTDLQAVVADYTFSPFGEMIGQWISDPSLDDFPFRFQSAYFDRETGLYYMGARYYDPSVAKWLTSSREEWRKGPGSNATGFGNGNPFH